MMLYVKKLYYAVDDLDNVSIGRQQKSQVESRKLGVAQWSASAVIRWGVDGDGSTASEISCKTTLAGKENGDYDAQEETSWVLLYADDFMQTT